MRDAAAAAADASPMEMLVAGTRYRMLDRIAVGSVCTLYRCQFASGGAEVEGIAKVARDPAANELVLNEASILRRLQLSSVTRPFVPSLVVSFGVGGEDSVRQANVLRYHEAIRSADELYTLGEVAACHRPGLDARDMAWVWRRLLTALGLVHAAGVVHCAVLPMHVLIEPKEHKLVLIDWCVAAHGAGTTSRVPVRIITGSYLPWYKRQGATRQPPEPGMDIALGARCMVELLGGDPVEGACPPTVAPAIQRYLSRCMAPSAHGVGPASGAEKLLEDFDRLIETLWGPRQFRVLEMPPRPRHGPG